MSPAGELFGQIYRGHEGLRRHISEFAAAFEVPSFFKHVIYLDRAEDLTAAGLPDRLMGGPRSGPTERA